MTALSLEVLECRYGKMLVFSEDQVIGRSLRLYGEWAEHELSLLRRYIVPGEVVLDVGANIGTHSLAFSHWVGDGMVVACEAQRLVANVLEVNCLLNGRGNVRVVQAACGIRGTRLIQASLEIANIGASRFEPAGQSLKRVIGEWFGLQSRQVLQSAVAVDDLVERQTVSLVKIDAEGMEYEVLRGARKTLQRSRPAVYFEQNDTSKLAQIYDFLNGLNYQLHWMETQPFNAANFRACQENVWWRTETGVLAVHASKEQPMELVKVSRHDQLPISQLDARVGTWVE